MARSVFVAVFLAALVANAVAVKLELLGMEHERLPGEYIIEYHNDPHSAKMFEHHLSNWQDHFASEPLPLARSLGFNMFHARLTDDEVAKVENFTEVKHISHNRIMKKSQAQTQTGATPSLDRIDSQTGLDGSYTALNDGSGVDIFVLDTGCDTDNFFWGDDPNKCTYLGDCAAPGITPRCDTSLQPRDDDGHGSHVAGSAGSERFGVAKGATVRCVRVLGSDGSGSIAGIINGMVLVAQTRNTEAAQGTGRPGVINMSLGGGFSSQLNDVCNQVVEAGTVVVVAAGNEAQDSNNVSPASATDVITVGSSQNNDVVSSFSNTGPGTDIFAVGSNVESIRANADGGVTLTISGTSMASPHVAGACAQLLSADPTRTPAQVMQIITSTATNNALSASARTVAGTPNLLLNVANAAFAGPAAALPEQTEEMDAQSPLDQPVPDSARCLTTVDAVEGAGALAAGAGTMFDIFALQNNNGNAPSLETITFYSATEITADAPATALVFTRAGEGYRANGAVTNSDLWDISEQQNGQGLVQVSSNGQTRTIGGTEVFENVVVLPEALELVVGSRNSVYLALSESNVVFQNQQTQGNQGVGNDDNVVVAPGRAIGRAPFSPTRFAENILPLVNLCYSPVVATQAVGNDAGLDTAIPPSNQGLDCLTNIQSDSDDISNLQNGVMFDLVVDGLASDVFLESFSVFLMDNMESGVAEVWTTLDGASYEGQENNPDAWRLIGSVDGMSIGLSNSGEGSMDVDEDDMAAPERPLTPELIDLDMALNFEITARDTPVGFYVTFRSDDMQYYETTSSERQTVAMNEYVSMTGGKGVVYPFGGTNNDMIFDMRQFSGQACFSGSATGSSGASSVAATPLTLIAGVVVSALVLIYN